MTCAEKMFKCWLCFYVMTCAKRIFRFFLLLFIPVIIQLTGTTQIAAATVEQWDVFEVTLTGPQSGNPYLDVQLSATFIQGRSNITVTGFYDGNGCYKIRFMPPLKGKWHYKTMSNVAQLNEKTGSFIASKPSAKNHGPVEVFKTFYFHYADGTPYHEFGTTCYAWVHQTEELQKQTLNTLAASPFNKVRFCVFPKHYVYNTNEPESFAFKKRADGTFDFDQPDPTFWRHFEQRILDLQKLGVQADIILWHPYDRWGFAEMSPVQDNRYLRYCIARFAAYRNVWWSLANEYDLMTDQPPQKHQGNKRFEDWDRFFSILEKEDPFHRLRGIHNGRKWYDHTKSWVTHASLQTSDMNGGVLFREKYQKPVIYDECKYEGNIPQGWGHLTPQEMTMRFWLGTLSGCYVGHGETYKNPEDILWWAKGGVLHGESPQRIQWLKDFMAKAPPFDQLQPVGDGRGKFLLAKPGEYYLFYPGSADSPSRTIELAGRRHYILDVIDPWAMTIRPGGSAYPGVFSVPPSPVNTIFRFTSVPPR